ncbi:MAG TPA: hypothetical protein VHC22_23170 [Pirellulales bacterium]|nr:hypothetical protein [Pirellulales bacterium]
MRFSLRWLFGVISFAAVACAGLVFPASLRISIGLAVHSFLLVSVLGALFAPRERRAFWGGCAIMGWFYLASEQLTFGLRPLREIVHGVLLELFRRLENSHSDIFEVGQTLAAFIVALIGGGIAHGFDRRAARKSREPPPAPI